MVQIDEDLLSPEALSDPYAYFSRLRLLDPIHWNPLWQGWIITRYNDVAAVLLDHQRFSSDRMAYLEAHASEAKKRALKTYRSLLSRWLVYLDPPDHTRLRLLYQQAAFTPRQLAAWRPKVQAIVDDLLGQIAVGTPVDFVQAFAFPLPVLVISEILGFPPEDRERVRNWTQEVALAVLLALHLDSTERWARVERAAEEFGEYARALIRSRKREPRDDLLTAMVQAEHRGEFLNEDEVVANTVLLMIAGHETTSNLLANGLLVFIRHPDEINLLRRAPHLIGPAIEECLRYDPPVKAIVRWAQQDLEMDGRAIRMGEKLLLALASANRDPQQLPDPDRFDITRGTTPQQHTAFAIGVHYCLGAPLARLEAEVAFATLFRRFHRVELITDRLEYRPMVITRSLVALPVVMA